MFAKMKDWCAHANLLDRPCHSWLACWNSSYHVRNTEVDKRPIDCSLVFCLSREHILLRKNL